MSIFIFGYQGNWNLGDDSTCLSLLLSLDEIIKEKKKVYIYSPENYLKINFDNLRYLTIRLVSSLSDTLLSLLHAKTIIIQGGDHLHDYGSLQMRLKVFSAFIALGFFTKLFRKKLLMVNAGFRIRTSFWQALLRFFLFFVSSLSVRDVESYSISSIFVRDKLVKGFDSAILIQSQKHVQSFCRDFTNEFCLGFSITPVYSNFFGNTHKDDMLSIKIAESLTDFLEINKTVRIFFLALNTSETVGDTTIIQKICSLLNDKYASRIEMLHYNGNLKVFVSKMDQLNAVVCCKYHSIIFSCILKKPLLVLNYHPKNIALVQEIGIPKNAVVSLDAVFRGDLTEKLQRLIEQPENHITHISLLQMRKNALQGIHRVWKKK